MSYGYNEKQYQSPVDQWEWEKWVYGALTGPQGMAGLWKNYGNRNWENFKENTTPTTTDHLVLKDLYLNLPDTKRWPNKNHIHIYKDSNTQKYMWHLTCGRNPQSQVIKKANGAVLVHIGQTFTPQEVAGLLPHFNQILLNCRQTAVAHRWQGSDVAGTFGGRKKRKKKYNHSSRRKTKRRRKKRRKTRRRKRHRIRRTRKHRQRGGA